jgi:hypothetical protein
MIEVLGEDHLLLPGLVVSGLAANDRVKYLLTLLQAARTSADGDADATDVRDERLATGVEDSQLDRVVADSVLESDARYRIPGAQTLARRLVLARSYVVRAARSAVGSEISNRGTRTENEKLLLRQCGKSEPVSSSLTVSPEANL